MKKNFTKYSILIGVWMILWIAASNISNVFGAPAQTWHDEPSTQEIITNTACIEYTTPTWTWIKCDDVIIQLKTWEVQEHEFFLQKWQKTWSMTNYTTWTVVVQSGEYIQYKVNFGSITWECRNGTIKDILPSCIKYISSEIHDISGTPTFSTWNWYLQYSNFILNGGTQWYILVTWQIIANTRNCENITRYVNTWAFKCGNPSTNWMYSSVVAIRTWWWSWGWSWSNVVFTKTWNKYEMHPGETWLVFTLKVKNEWPNAISDIIIEDIRPDNGRCIMFDSRTWQNLEWLWAYRRKYTWTNGILRARNNITLRINASIANDPSCTWSYINTWKLTYVEWWETHTLYDYYPFIVVDAGVGYDVSIQKTVDHQIVRPHQDIVYTIKYTNVWTKPLTNYTITDERPNDKLIFNGSDTTWYEISNNWYTITWFFEWPLNPWRSGRIKIYATVR